MTEVRAKAERRRFTTSYKKEILAKVAACKERGEVGALLRREGLYSSHIAAWREAEARGELASAESKKRGPKAKAVDPSAKRAEQLERRVVQLEKKLENAHAIIAIQKKVAALLGNPIPDDEEMSSWKR
jgi:transposase